MNDKLEEEKENPYAARWEIKIAKKKKKKDNNTMLDVLYLKCRGLKSLVTK